MLPSQRRGASGRDALSERWVALCPKILLARIGATSIARQVIGIVFFDGVDKFAQPSQEFIGAACRKAIGDSEQRWQWAGVGAVSLTLLHGRSSSMAMFMYSSLICCWPAMAMAMAAAVMA